MTGRREPLGADPEASGRISQGDRLQARQEGNSPAGDGSGGGGVELTIANDTRRLAEATLCYFNLSIDLVRLSVTIAEFRNELDRFVKRFVDLGVALDSADKGSIARLVARNLGHDRASDDLESVSGRRTGSNSDEGKAL